MKSNNLHTLCLVFLLFAKLAPAQTAEDSLRFDFFTGLPWYYGVLRPEPATNDTLWKQTYFFDKVSQDRISGARSGGGGSASQDRFENLLPGKQMRSGQDRFNPLLVHPMRVIPGDTVRRFSNIDYHLGSKKEQHIFLTHRQWIKPWILAGLDFGAFGSQGDFSRQKNTNRSFDVWLAASTRSRVYRVYGSFTSNRVLNQENGGITTDTTFENASALNTRTLPINLQAAETKYRTRDYLLRQDLDLFGLFGRKNQSMFPEGDYDNHLYVTNTTHWSRSSTLFTSSLPDTSYFNNTYYDLQATYDSTFVNDLFTQSLLRFSREHAANSNRWEIGAGLNYQWVGYHVFETDTNFTSTSWVAEAGYHMNGLDLEATVSADAGGTMEHSYQATFSASKKIGNANSVYVDGWVLKRPQNLMDRLYQSNHFRWDHHFLPLETTGISAGCALGKIDLDINIKINWLNNYVYYDAEALPVQFNERFSLSRIELSKVQEFGKFGTFVKVQAHVSGAEEVASLQPLAGYVALYYKNLFFKQALRFRAGIDVRTGVAYEADGYMPATGVFFNQDEKRLGDYPFGSVFINLGIKTATLFLRFDHVNAGLNTRTYYGAWHYPMPGRTFKFGVNWNLRN